VAHITQGVNKPLSLPFLSLAMLLWLQHMARDTICG
jgi:hypothetical protein